MDLLTTMGAACLHTLLIYLALCAALRLMGRRQMGELSSTDLAIILLLGSAVETAMVGGNTSLGAGLASVTTLLATNRVLNVALVRWPRFRRLMLGEPLLLVHRGEVVSAHLRQAGLTHVDLIAAIRERGYATLADVRFAVLEVDGSISVVPAEHHPPAERNRHTHPSRHASGKQTHHAGRLDL